jgi:hypothetical protein
VWCDLQVFILKQIISPDIVAQNCALCVSVYMCVCMHIKLLCFVTYSFSLLWTGKYTCKNYKRIAMEHSELVAEMVHVERLTTQERLHLARHRRLQQLKVWRQREKEWLRHQTRHTSNKRHIYFSDSVMLLEAAARNDIDEGKKFCTYSQYTRAHTPHLYNFLKI